MTPTLTQHPGWLSACNGIWSRRPKWPVKVLSPDDLRWATEQVAKLNLPTGPDYLRDGPRDFFGLKVIENLPNKITFTVPEPTVPPNWSESELERYENLWNEYGLPKRELWEKWKTDLENDPSTIKSPYNL